MGNRDKKEKEKPKDRQAAVAIAVDEHETDQPVTMAVVRELLEAQESRLKSQFESVVLMTLMSFFHTKMLTSFKKTLNDELPKLSEWCNANKLSVNLKKSR